jgi:hypothetical protein
MQGWFLDRQAVVLRLRETMRARSASVDAGTAGEQSAREARVSLTRASGSPDRAQETQKWIRGESHVDIFVFVAPYVDDAPSQGNEARAKRARSF